MINPFYIPQQYNFAMTTNPLYLVEEFIPININNEYITNDYLISNYGRVYSNKRKRLLSPDTDKNGYSRVNLQLPMGPKKIHIHRIVMMAFKPIQNLKEFQVNHINGIKSCNIIWNLEWSTSSENNLHAVRMGLNKNFGENSHCAILSNTQANQVCMCLEDGYSYEYIKNYIKNNYNLEISRYIISNIANGKTWTHISKNYNIQIPNSKPKLFTEYEIHKICIGLKNNRSFPDILMDIGIDLNLLNQKDKKCIFTCISNIKTKKTFLNISDIYF